MTLNAPLNAKTMVPSSAEFFVAKRWSDTLLQVGVYKDPDINVGGETVDDIYANYRCKKMKNGNQLTLNFNLHEQNTAVLAVLENGVVEYKTEVGTVTGRIETYSPGQWSYENDILLDKANDDGTAIAPTTVQALISGVWTDLDLTDDYIVGVTTTGKTYLKLVSGSTLDANSPKTVQIRVTYSATPDDTVIYAEHSKDAIAKNFVTVIDWTWDYN